MTKEELIRKYEDKLTEYKHYLKASMVGENHGNSHDFQILVMHYTDFLRTLKKLD